MKTIFTVTMVTSLQPNRIVGWFETYNEAERVVVQNLGDIRECSYRLCVIEEIQGNTVYPCPPISEQWFRWATDIYVKIKKPDLFKRTINFGIG